MDLRFVTGEGIEDHPLTAVSELQSRTDGYLWLHVSMWSAAVDAFLAEQFAFHPIALETCGARNHMSMVHGYADHVFFVVHRPVVLVDGQLEMLELDVFLGQQYIVTVDHPTDLHAGIATQAEARLGGHAGGVPESEVAETLQRIEAGRILPANPGEMLHAIVSLTALRQRIFVQEVARRVGSVETQVVQGELSDPEASLEEMFTVRYELLSVRTASANNEEVMARGRKLLAALPGKYDDQLADLQDMFRRVHRMTDSEQDFLTGVIDLYRTRTDTKMMIATERLAVLAAVTLPITAIASVYGMNVIVYRNNQPYQLALVLLVMLAVSGMLLRWTKRQGWW